MDRVYTSNQIKSALQPQTNIPKDFTNYPRTEMTDSEKKGIGGCSNKIGQSLSNIGSGPKNELPKQTPLEELETRIDTLEIDIENLGSLLDSYCRRNYHEDGLKAAEGSDEKDQHLVTVVRLITKVNRMNAHVDVFKQFLKRI